MGSGTRYEEWSRSFALPSFRVLYSGILNELISLEQLDILSPGLNYGYSLNLIFI